MLLMYKQKTTLDGVQIVNIHGEFNTALRDFLDICFIFSSLVAFYYWLKMAIADYL